MRALIVLCLLLPAMAMAQVPQKLGYQGRLLKADGTPEAGAIDITFKILDAESAGATLWEETQKVGLTDGFYATFLGDKTAFPAKLFDGKERFLELTVGGSPLTPRQRVASVAYALSAGSALSVAGGAVDATSISVNGKPVIDSSGNLSGTATYKAGAGVEIAGTTISLLKTCQDGEVLKWNSTTTSWACGGTTGGTLTSVTALAPLSATTGNAPQLSIAKADATTAGFLAATDFTRFDAKVDGVTASSGGGVNVIGTARNPAIALQACASGEVLKFGANGWACSVDLDTNSGGTVTGVTATSGGGLLAGGTPTAPSLGLVTCAAGELLKFDGASSSWLCGTDGNSGGTVTAVGASAGGGLLAGGTSSAPTLGLKSCAAGEVLKFDGASSAWVCGADLNSGVGATPGGGLLAAGSAGAPTLGLRACAAGEVLKYDGATGAWLCGADANSGGSVTGVSAPAAGGLVTGGTAAAPSLSMKTCAAGEILKYAAGSWGCAADANSGGSVTGVTAPGAGGLVTGGTAAAPTLALRTCANNERLQYSAASSAWLCVGEAGSASYIQNQVAAGQVAGFNVSGTGTVGTLVIGANQSSLGGVTSYLTGALGVGNNNPNLGKLTVTGNWTGSVGALGLVGDKPTIRLDSSQGAGANEKWLMHVGSPSGGGLEFYESTDGASWGTSKLSISPAGNVGVGVPLATARLDVAGDVKATNLKLAGQATGMRLENAAAPPVTCGPTLAGYVYFNTAASAFLGCNGTSWICFGCSVGLDQSTAGLSCKDIKTRNPGAADGSYWIDPDGGSTANAYRAWCDMNTSAGGWTLALNLDTSDGHVMWWGNAAWTDTSVYGSALSPFASDHKSESYNSMGGATEILLVVHTNGTIVGWKQFSKASGATLLAAMQGGDNALIGTAVTASNVGAIWAGERLVKISTTLYANHCVASGGGCTSGATGSPDGDRIGSNEATPSDNVGGGLGNWHDMNYCCGGPYGSGKICNGSSFRTTSEAQGGWAGCYGSPGGPGFFGTDTFGPAAPTCGNTTCGNSNWSAASGFNYDYSIYLR